MGRRKLNDLDYSNTTVDTVRKGNKTNISEKTIGIELPRDLNSFVLHRMKMVFFFFHNLWNEIYYIYFICV